MQFDVPAYITRYWGKARPAEGQGPAWHPLAYHALDVAAAMEALLAAWPWALRAVAERAALPEEAARRWLIAVAGLHDLGKFADAFQAKVPEHWQGAASWQGPPPRDGFDHGAYGLNLWAGIAGLARLALPDRNSERRFERWLACACSHHGSPVGKADYQERTVLSPRAKEDAAAYVAALLTLLDPRLPEGVTAPSMTRGKGPPPLESWLVAGLCVLADWIGSNQRWFAYHSPTLDLTSYWETVARRNAGKALAAAGLTAAPLSELLTLDQLLNSQGAAPSPLQAAAAETEIGSGPTLLVLEDLTGAGKTEAALLLAHRLCRAGHGTGLFMALPTQATSNLIYKRLAAAYRAFFAAGSRPSLVLAHGAVDLHEAFWASIVVGEQEEQDERPGEATASGQCAAWLADDRRKAFLAQLGVGTLDQALIAVHPRRFNTLRLLGLAGRVLIVDEVHSYDSYMTRTLQHLLRFHAALGGSAILLSATLTTGTKQQLLEAFAEGTGLPRPTCGTRAFPLLTRLDGSGLTECAVGATRGTRRDLPVAHLATTQEAIDFLLREAEAGRCAVWIRNSVQDAIEAWEALRAAAKGRPDLAVDLFHARFTQADRRTKEAAVLERFGKASRPEARRGRILVATQVVEQSLDLDFDAMVSDLAPLDLLIQRAGRLQRHARDSGRPPPVLHILAPPLEDNAAANWYARLLPRAARVYPNHAQLWASWRTLQRGLNLASENPRLLLEEVFDAVAALAVPESLQRSALEQEGRASGERSAADVALKVWEGFGGEEATWGDEGLVPTRLGEPTRLLRLAAWREGALHPLATAAAPRRAWRLSEVQVAARRVAALPPPAPAEQQAIAAALESWPRRLRESEAVLPVPMTWNNEAACWHATVLDGNRRRLTLLYDEEAGLRYGPRG